jgi:pimeloyl-ACP methyl ester carboxylesterase
VYAPVHPGFGESDGLDQIEDILDLTLYHFDLLDALGLQAPHVVGHFFGAMIAAEMASVRPDGVGKLVLASPAGLWVDRDPGVDYFATPADELRALLFSDPESAIAQQSMPDPKDDEERGLQGIERARSLSAVAKFLWPIPDKGL